MSSFIIGLLLYYLFIFVISMSDKTVCGMGEGSLFERIKSVTCKSAQVVTALESDDDKVRTETGMYDYSERIFRKETFPHFVRG